MKKILIFLREDVVLPKGGPSGYVYNLMSGMKEEEDIKIDLLPAVTNAELKNKYDSLPLWIKKGYRVIGRYKDYKNLSKPSSGITSEFLNQYDLIHFHSCFSLFKNIPVLKNYTGKVVLTSHCPKPPQLEMIEDMYSEGERRIFGKRHLGVYTMAVTKAFERADIIIFPCPEAEEPYANNWDNYQTIKKQNLKKYRYMATGVASCLEKVVISKSDIRKKYGIPEDAFLISYVGRHNTVKGYDTLREIAKRFSKKDNIYFLIAGEESPLTRPNLPFWIEAGWTKDPYSIEAASDLFVLPNKETYFDLVLLEVLSIGVKVLATYTGGNKYFKDYDSDIMYFNSIDDAVQTIQKLSAKRSALETVSKNRNLYLTHFTSEQFAKNYLKIIRGVLSE